MKLAGIPWIVEKTNLIYDPKKWKLKLSLADSIICLSNDQKEQLKDYKKKITLIPTGVDIERYANALPASRVEFGMDEEDIILISVAHLIEVKGHRELLKAFANVRQQVPKLKLLLVGEGSTEYTTELKNLATILNLNTVVCFAGNRSDIPALLKMSNGKILATRNTGRKEGYGAAIVEAMAAGLPVIATRSGGPEDIVIPGKTGWLIEAEGTEQMEKALVMFYQNRDQWHNMGLAAYHRAVEEYNVELMVKRYMLAYEKLANKK